MIGGGANALAQLATGQSDPVSLGMAGVTGAVSSGMGFVPALLVNVGGALTGSASQGQNPNGAMAGAAVGTALGYPVGAKIEGHLDEIINPWYRSEWKEIGMGVSTYVPKSPVPSWFGAAVGNAVQEKSSSPIQNKVEEKK